MWRKCLPTILYKAQSVSFCTFAPTFAPDRQSATQTDTAARSYCVQQISAKYISIVHVNASQIYCCNLKILLELCSL